MEEILSSIRRIIADEETEESKPDDEPEGASASAEGALESLDVLDDDDDDDADDDVGDVLELTSVVDDDGDIVDLGAASAAPVPLEVVEDPVDDDIEIEDDLPTIGDLTEIEDISDPEPEEPDASALPEIDLIPLQDESLDLDSVDTIPVNTTEDIAIQEDEPAVSTKKAESEALLSTGTASTTTGAFAKLSKAFRPTPVEESVADGAGRTVEQFIEDMARPMLKEWLDENMPAIVERLVQKEIQKIARRAELL